MNHSCPTRFTHFIRASPGNIKPPLTTTTLSPHSRRLVGNIASEAVDPNAEKTKAVLKRHRAFEKMLAHLFSDDWMTLVYTLGAIQNTCTEIEYVELMQEFGAVARLQELVRSGDTQLEQYAKGCLAHICLLYTSPSPRD